MNAIECIGTRRSVREYKNIPVDEETLNTIITSAICAPSGKNGQPWRFKMVMDKELINEVSQLSVYYPWMRTASVLVLVFLDHSHSYNYIKDVQSCGAAIQNILLTAHALRLGSCWIGEVIDKGLEIKGILDIENDDLELMGVVSLGYVEREPKLVGREAISHFLI